MKRSLVTQFSRWFVSFAIVCFVVVLTLHSSVLAQGEVSMHTTYTEITVPPGETVRFTIDLENHSNERQDFGLQVNQAPDGWNYDLSSGGWDVQRVAIKPGESITANFRVEVPLQVDRGSYTFVLEATGQDTLPIIVNVSEQGVFQSEWTTSQSNMEGHTDSTFRFQTTLHNRTAEAQPYGLRAQAEPGWTVQFNADGNSVTAVEVEANEEKSIQVNVQPPPSVKEGTYKIPLQAFNNSTSAEVELEVVITGTYGLELTTPNELLSTEITAGSERTVDLVLRNTGSAPLENIELSGQAPMQWDVTFEPSEVERLEAGDSTTVKAQIKADSKALAGDYVTRISADAAEATDSQTFRITVETPVLWGWIGVIIILAVIGGIFYLFRVYGRR